jgi:tRNA threonylcarbamoyladenosine biosynthesis protein TsaE
MQLELRTPTAQDTRDVGAAIAGLLRPADAVALTGELGAGKTTLVQGAARGLGVDGPVVSPTFTLVREYEGRIPVIHVDVYRLDHVQEVIDLDLEERSSDGVTFVEWGDVVEALLPEDRLIVELTAPDPTSEARRLRVVAVGDAWRGRWDELAASLRAWAVEGDSVDDAHPPDDAGAPPSGSPPPGPPRGGEGPA